MVNVAEILNSHGFVFVRFCTCGGTPRNIYKFNGMQAEWMTKKQVIAIRANGKLNAVVKEKNFPDEMEKIMAKVSQA